MKFRASQPERREGLVLAIDRDQTALESYAVTVWLVAHWACFVLAWLEAFLPWAAAAVLAIVVGILRVSRSMKVRATAIFRLWRPWPRWPPPARC